MHCPQLLGEQSLSHGQSRFEKAAQTLGKDVLKRLIIFVLYTLGFNREIIAKLFGYQVAGVKTLVDRVLINGLEGFYDHQILKAPKFWTIHLRPSGVYVKSTNYKEATV